MAHLSPCSAGSGCGSGKIVPLKWASARIPSMGSTASTAALSCGPYESSEESDCDCPECRERQAAQQPWLWQLGGGSPGGWVASAWAVADNALADLTPKLADLTPKERTPREHSLVLPQAVGSIRQRCLALRKKFSALPRGRSRAGCGDLFTWRGLQMQAGPLLDETEDGLHGELQDPSRTVEAVGAAAVFFAVLTLLQVCGALLAHSSALLVDCISMGVDAAAYAGSMVVESQTDKHWRAGLELLIGGASIGALASFSACALHDAWSRVGQAEAADGARPSVVLLFGALGALCDAAWVHEVRKDFSNRSWKQMSVWAVLLHFATDAGRSLTLLCMPLSVLALGADGAAADVWASLVVGAMLLARAGLGLVEWLQQLDRLAFGRAALFGSWALLEDRFVRVTGSENDGQVFAV